jgi:hypothetical protein
MRMAAVVACLLLGFVAGCAGIARDSCSSVLPESRDWCCVQKGAGNTFDGASGKCVTLLGKTCGTVSPGYRDECCVKRGQGNRYDAESEKCITV